MRHVWAPAGHYSERTAGRHARLSAPWDDPPAGGFCHQALYHRGRAELLNWVVPFLRRGVAAGQPVMALVRPETLAELAAAVRDLDGAVELVDVEQLGHHGTRTIPAWLRFSQRHGDAVALRGVSEVPLVDLSPELAVEAVRSEDLCNVALDPLLPLWLVCTYDLDDADAGVLAASRRNHRFVASGTAPRPNPECLRAERLGRPSTLPLPAPPPRAARMTVTTVGRLAELRLALAESSPSHNRIYNVQLAADEVATNALCHGRQPVEVTWWSDDAGFHVEVADAGQRLPDPAETGGRGMWLANELSDLVQVRALPSGTVVRLTWYATR